MGAWRSRGALHAHIWRQGMWLNPAWVDTQLAAVDIHCAHLCMSSSWSSPDDLDHGRLAGAGYGSGNVTAESVSNVCEQGQLADAVEGLGVLVQTGCRVSKSLFYAVLRQCVVKKDLVLGRCVHALSVKNEYESDTFLCNHVLRMYASHDRLQEAMDVFTVVAEPDAFMWSSIISAHVKHGESRQAIRLYDQMRRSSVKPDGHVFVAALQACAKSADLTTGKQVHADVCASGLRPDVFVSHCLVEMYAKCGSLDDAQKVFDGIQQKDVVIWNAMIAGYAQHGMGREALHLYSAMQEDGIVAPTSGTFVYLLQACASIGSLGLEKGQQLHAQIREKGLQLDAVLGCSLVNMYAKCGSLLDAHSVFERLVEKDVVAWTALIAAYAQHGLGEEALHLYSSMREEGITTPDSVTFLCLLQACGSMGAAALNRGKQLHVQVREEGLDADVGVGCSLVNMYAKCGSLDDAQCVFDGLVQKNVATWTAMISGYCQQGMGQEALRLYNAMKEESIVTPDSVTFVCLLQACASVGVPALEQGKQLHIQLRKQGLEADVVVCSSLVNMYAKCGALQDAQTVFDELSLYSDMQEDGITAPTSAIYVCLLQACASVGTLALEKGKQLHAQIRGQGLEADGAIGCSLVNMYAKCGSLEDAQMVFGRLCKKDVSSWTALIAGYSQQGMGQEALRLYSAMQIEGIVAPDSVTFVCLLQACANIGTLALGKGKQLHAQIREQGLQTHVVVANSLVNMYAKCGSLEDAQRVFDQLGQKSVVTWTALIAGYSQQGMSQEALNLFNAMQEQGMAPPNSVTFVCLLQACANVAGLHPGRQLHAEIEEQGLQADLTLGHSLINMYAKSGSMIEAQHVFEALPERGVVAWNTLIAGFTREGDSEAVFDLFHKMKEDGVQPDEITFLSVLTVCSHVGLVNKGREYFESMSRSYGITPTAEHYTCMVDLLSRAGQLDEALALARTMPLLPNAAVWHTLLAACQKWSNVEVGRHAFHEAVKLDDKDAAAYVLMSNIFTNAQMFEDAEEMQERRKGLGAWKQPGLSWWTDMDGLVHSFVVGDIKHPESNEMSQQYDGRRSNVLTV